MGDFYLDLRSSRERGELSERVDSSLRWLPETTIHTYTTKSYSLVIGRTENSGLWNPAVRESPAGRLIVALAGRIAFDKKEWDLGHLSSARGGLACRVVAELYTGSGICALEALSGNFTVIVLDEAAGRCHLVNDQSGLQIGYRGTSPETSNVMCSHPDVLADVLGQSHQLDLVSLEEFVASGRITFPFTYYERINALSPRTCYSFHRCGEFWEAQPSRCYFELQPQFATSSNVGDLSLQFAAVFQDAVARRTLPILGKVALAMSGGMDSRAVLSCISDKELVRGFVLIDQENPESAAAGAVARAHNVTFDIIKRPFDYYASTAALGARISGGMGGLASNHFLGILPWIRSHDISNLLTGCYCDYLFKALALNTAESRIIRKERLAPVKMEYYRPIFRNATLNEKAVGERLSSRLPARSNLQPSDEELFEVECLRTFPLAYEADCAQRVIGQRVSPWNPPMADRSLMQFFRRIPSRFKLNGDLFRGMLRTVCSAEVLKIPNSNTGASILAGVRRRAYHRYKSALLNRISAKRAQGIATRGSWPNWEYYIRHSPSIREQWQGSSSSTMTILHEIVSPAYLVRSVDEFRGKDVELFQRLWTLKLWLEHRVGTSNIIPYRSDGLGLVHNTSSRL